MMPFGRDLLNNHQLQTAALALIAAASVTVYFLRRKRISPEELERRRRLEVYRRGRLIDGLITEIHEDTIYFSYLVNGAEYQATQNVSALRDKLPAEPHRSIGPVTLRYVTRNPANSIVICEQWSGLREAEREE
jgi:hypothetical protein